MLFVKNIKVYSIKKIKGEFIMARVLVTGGSGFIGTYAMKRLLEKGHSVTNYDLVTPSEERLFVLRNFENRIPFEKGGVEDLPSLIAAIKKHDTDTVVHTAAIVEPTECHENPGITYKINMGGTINVLEAARLLDLKRVIYMSSIGVYTTKKYEPIDENHPVLQSDEGPASTAYGASKVGGECFCWAYHERYGLDFIALRPSAVYGFGMKLQLFINPIVESAVRGERLVIDHGRDYPRDYTYVEDVAQAIQLSVDVDSCRLKDRIFLVASGQKLITPGQLAQIIREFIPTADINIGSGLHGFDQREVLFRGILDISRIKTQLGFEPQYDIRKGIQEYIALYRGYLEKITKGEALAN